MMVGSDQVVTTRPSCLYWGLDTERQQADGRIGQWRMSREVQAILLVQRHKRRHRLHFLLCLRLFISGESRMVQHTHYQLLARAGGGRCSQRRTR